MEWYHFLFAFIGALIAGGINAVSGNGSAITLSILTELIGLPGNMANGTNRVGVLFNGVGSSWGFHKGGKSPGVESRPIMIAIVLGAILGGVVAIMISNEQFMSLFRVLMVFMLAVILVKPKRWLIDTKGDALISMPLQVSIFFILGIYGGLIQMGMGIFFLAVAVLVSRYPLMEANAIKAIVITIYTVMLVALFEYRGMIQWPIGLTMGAGQFIGGMLAARVASKHPAATKWVYRLLIGMIVLALLSLFEII